MIVRDWVRETDDQAMNSDSKRRLPRSRAALGSARIE
jgi:hypothetical protein